MGKLVVFILVAAGLHLVLHLPIGFAIVVALLATLLLWLVWRLKWWILAIIGLEEMFGGRRDDDGDGGMQV